MRLYILIPSMDTVHADFMVSVAALNQALFNHPPKGLEAVRLINERGSLIVQSREFLVKRAVEEGATHLLFLDSDMKFPQDIVHRLLAHDKPVVGCNYVKRIVPATPNSVTIDGKPCYTTEESSGLEQVRSMGFGCVLIDAEVFKSMARPWFDSHWIERPNGEISLVGEDNFFFWRLVKDGEVQAFVDHDLSKEIAHIGVFDYINSMAVITQEVVSGDN